MFSAFMLKQNYLKSLFLKFTHDLTLGGKKNKNSNCFFTVETTTLETIK